MREGQTGVGGGRLSPDLVPRPARGLLGQDRGSGPADAGRGWRERSPTPVQLAPLSISLGPGLFQAWGEGYGRRWGWGEKGSGNWSST